MIKDCLDKLLKHSHKMSELVEELPELEADEFVAVDDIRQLINRLELKIHEAREIFERR